jgi:nicotinamide-nucleotide amidase
MKLLYLFIYCMKAEIISIGDEILIGQIVNTNAVWMAQQLNLIGMQVAAISTVSDAKTDIEEALQIAWKRADIVLMTGGLGPTKDDVTKRTLADYFNCQLIINDLVLNDVTDFFLKRGREVSPINRDQALVPSCCEVIRNSNGTAPGMWFEKGGKVCVSMPGVPYEMKEMMIQSVLPKLKQNFNLPFIYHKTILTQGIGESVLAERIEVWEDALAAKNIKLAYLPQPGMVRLRLSAHGRNKAELTQSVESEIQKVLPLIQEYVFGYEAFGEKTPEIQKITLELLKQNGKTVSVAESCTGGYISSLFTSIPGSSEVFKGGIVPYSNQAKHDLLGVAASIFEQHGAVSEACVVQLAEGAVRKFESDYSISVSGIAGPGGGTSEKPVGFVWIAVSNGKNTQAKSFQFGDNRQRNIIMTANAAINMLRKFVLETC